MKRAAQGAAWGAAITRNAALSPSVGREGQPHTPSHRGTDSAEPPLQTPQQRRAQILTSFGMVSS